ncbi:diguanylate cyclase domain-containing protein [Frankia sp. AiPa1]|uniref:diguanylate cyclase domain-containing protein n=1 Tax=Frankia sp. AiPa1 TaxID=573492 RepID=UPI00202BA0F6|nr:diguanylate cyclase [Frankia sp. AiPa1]MCL9760298.1 GGDEF domain-containing protein [Frankia sp. AiPa1]
MTSHPGVSAEQGGPPAAAGRPRPDRPDAAAWRPWPMDGLRPPPRGVAGPVGERTCRRVAVGVVVLLAALLIPLLLLLGGRSLVTFEAAALLVSSLVGIVLGGVAVRRTHGGERLWRLLLVLFMLGLLVGGVHWCLMYVVRASRVLVPSALDGAYLLPNLFVLVALLLLPGRPLDPTLSDRAPPSEDRSRLVAAIVMVLDSLVIVTAMFLIAWTALLRQVAHSGMSGLPFLISLGYPVSGTLVIVTLLLVVIFRRPYNGRALVVLTVGLLALNVSATLFVRLTVSGIVDTDRLAPYWLGPIIAPPLMALAMLIPGRPDRQRHARTRGGDVAAWVHSYLPYLPPALAAVLVIPTISRGDQDSTTARLAIVLVVLVVARQMIMIGQNTRLLMRVRAAQWRLRYQALHDPLTGLANRALFSAELDAAVEAQRTFAQPVVMLFCDLDEFKAVNDTFGHAAGDELLRAVAGRLRGLLRADDVAARIGGDEFAVLLGRFEGEPRAVGAAMAGRITAAMSPTFPLQGMARRLQISVGVAVAEADTPDVTAEGLMHRADMAMYQAKSRRSQEPSRQCGEGEGEGGSRSRSGIECGR